MIVRTLTGFIALLLVQSAIRAEDGAVLFRTRAAQAIVTVSADHKLAAVASGDKTVHVIDLVSGKMRRSIKSPAVSLTFSSDGKTVFAGGAGVAAWDVETGNAQSTLATKIEDIRSVAITADDRLLATGAPHGAARLWLAPTGREETVFHLGH